MEKYYFTPAKGSDEIKIVFSLAFLFVFSLFYQVRAQTEIRVNHLLEGEQNTDGANSIVVNQTGIYVLWSDYSTSFHTYLSRSTDGDTRYQSLFVSQTDTLFATWTDNRFGNNDVFFTREFIGNPKRIKNFDFILGEQEEIMIPGNNPWGLVHMPDGAISYSKTETEYRMWISTARWTTLLRGPDLDHLVPYPLDAQGIAQMVLGPSSSGFDSTYAGAYSVIPAFNNTDLLMIYHAENHPCPDSYAPVRYGIGLARSFDEGLSWQKKGQILTSYVAMPENLCEFFEWGLGNPTVYLSPEKDYIYMLFGEWLRGAPLNRPDGIYLARAAIESDGEPGNWEKFNNGGFSEPGIGGLGTLVVEPPKGINPNYAAQPSVSFNSFLNLYVLVFQSRLGLHMATSEDGIAWTDPQLAWEVPDVYIGNTTNTPWVAYFSLISPEQPSQMTTSQTGYLYFARGYPNWNQPTTMSRRSFQFREKSTSSSGIKPDIIRSTLRQNYPNPFESQTTFGFYIPFTEKVMLKVYDYSGREISTILNEVRPAGNQEIVWNSTALSSGIYVYKLITPSGSCTRKMVVQKFNP